MSEAIINSSMINIGQNTRKVNTGASIRGSNINSKETLTMNIKEAVWIRDNRKCIFCNLTVPIDSAKSRFIKKSEGGLDIPENLVTACDECNFKFQYGYQQEELSIIAEKYLKNYYKDNWNKEKLYISKEEDMKRRNKRC